MLSATTQLLQHAFYQLTNGQWSMRAKASGINSFAASHNKVCLTKKLEGRSIPKQPLDRQYLEYCCTLPCLFSGGLCLFHPPADKAIPLGLTTTEDSSTQCVLRISSKCPIPLTDDELLLQILMLYRHACHKWTMKRIQLHRNTYWLCIRHQPFELLFQVCVFHFEVSNLRLLSCKISVYNHWRPHRRAIPKETEVGVYSSSLSNRITWM